VKPYGNSRRDNLTCRHGCCSGKYMKPKAGDVGTRRGRKRARQMDKELVVEDDWTEPAVVVRCDLHMDSAQMDECTQRATEMAKKETEMRVSNDEVENRITSELKSAARKAREELKVSKQEFEAMAARAWESVVWDDWDS